MFLTFKSLDGTPYQPAKKNDKQTNGHKGRKATNGPKPIYTECVTTKSTTGTSDAVIMSAAREFPPTQMPPIDVYDLTPEEESQAPLPKSGPQKATQEQATHDTEDGNGQDRETVTHVAGAEHNKEGRSPKDGGRLASEADSVQTSSRNHGRESVDSVSTRGSMPSAQPPPNGTAGLPINAASNAMPTLGDSCGPQAAGLSCYSNTSSQDEPEAEPDNYESAKSDGGLYIKLEMDNGEDILPDEWEGKIIGEEDDKYLVTWENSFIPKENTSIAIVQI